MGCLETNMLACRSLVTKPLRLLQHHPWPISSVVAPSLGESRLEEENTPYYSPKRFYPTRIGEILNNRYQVATKLGYGTNSTVWLARDLFQWRWKPEVYVAVKINAIDRENRDDALQELKISKRVSKHKSRHEGSHFVRQLLDSFTLRGFSGDHICLVFVPLREPLWILRDRFVGNVIPPQLLKIMVQMLLRGLDYLHRECSVIHTDLKLDNVMVRFEDTSILENDARDELLHPLPSKQTGDRNIYLPRNNYGSSTPVNGIVSIADLGHARDGAILHHGCIQAEPYRAPEVILDAGWTYSADICNLGVLLWNLLENKTLFDAVDPLKNDYNEGTHLASITALLGPAPESLVSSRKRCSSLYDSGGQLVPTIEIPNNFTLHDSITRLEGEDKAMFLHFVK